MLAPPWLSIPPEGYGGTENVLDVLVPALRDLGAEVELFTIGASTVKADKKHWLYKDEQYKFIHDPAYNSLPIVIAHTLYALNKIKAAGDFDIIHGHNPYTDPLAMLYSSGNLPPMLHTLHGPPFTTQDRLDLNIPDNRPMWREVAKTKSNNLYLVGISKSLMKNAPPGLKRISLPPVHNGVDTSRFPFVEEKSDYFATLARSHPDKGQAIAVRACFRLGYKLKLAGVVVNMTKPREVMLELANPLSPYRGLIDFRYFSDEIFPYLTPGEIDYVGDLSLRNKVEFLAHARALLFPIQWDEPFGMAPIEALACGTPVVAMARGALTEIIQHGVNGFLAKNEQEFEEYMERVDEIDPTACRKSVEDNFSAHHMAEEYLKRYKQVIKRHSKSGRNRQQHTDAASAARPIAQHNQQATQPKQPTSKRTINQLRPSQRPAVKQ